MDLPQDLQDASSLPLGNPPNVGTVANSVANTVGLTSSVASAPADSSQNNNTDSNGNGGRGTTSNNPPEEAKYTNAQDSYTASCETSIQNPAAENNSNGWDVSASSGSAEVWGTLNQPVDTGGLWNSNSNPSDLSHLVNSQEVSSTSWAKYSGVTIGAKQEPVTGNNWDPSGTSEHREIGAFETSNISGWASNNNGGVASKVLLNPTRFRESDLTEVENKALAKRSEEFTEEFDIAMQKAIFSEHVNTGINFDKYDAVTAKVTGRNAPAPISSFHEAGLHRHVMHNIELCEYTKPTPVQKYAIPIIMNGRDMMACAQTGSGKTAAFVAPIVSQIITNGLSEMKPRRRNTAKASPVCIIIAPTRELAVQIFDECRKFTYRTGIRPCVCYGGQPPNLQLEDLEKGCDILVGTPGRINDFVNRGKVRLSGIRFLLLDEADRMLDMGFEPQIRQIISGSGFTDIANRQTLMFSATFPLAVQQLASRFLKAEYLFLAVGNINTVCENVEQTIIMVDGRRKRDELVEILRNSGRQRTLIFVSNKKTADSLDEYLFENGFPSTSIHGDCTQPQRESALAAFKSGHHPILVATDVASRGLDIPEVHHVIIYDMPNDADTYVHRVGRTGRAGNTGKATAFYTSRDCRIARSLVQLLKDSGQHVPDFLQQDIGGETFSDIGNARGMAGYAGRDVRHSNW